MKRLFLFVAAIIMFCNLSAQDSMFPSIIMNSKINSTDSNNYMNPAFQFHITSIDWDSKIVTIDKNVILPDVKNMLNAQYWQMFVVKGGLLDNNQVLQLVSQTNQNTFVFNILSVQNKRKLSAVFSVNSIIGFRNPQQTWTPLSLKPIQFKYGFNGFDASKEVGYKVGDIITVINPKGENAKFKIDNIYNDSTDGSLSIIKPIILEAGDGFEVGDKYKTSGGSGSGLIVPCNYIIDYTPTNSYADKVTIVNRFCTYVNRYKDKFIGLFPYNDGVNILGFAKSSSVDFINWGKLKPVVPVTLGVYPSWMDTNYKTILPCIAQNNIVDNKHIIPFRQNLILKPSVCRIGIMTTSDFTNFTYSPHYFTCDNLPDNNNITWNSASYCLFKGVHYIAADITLNNDLSQRRCYLFSWSGETSDMKLKLVQKIGDNKPKYSWNSYFSSTPSMFIYNEKLYMIIEGNSAKNVMGLQTEFGNRDDCNGLFIFNEEIGLFEEYFSNPVIANVVLDERYKDYNDHQGGAVIYQYKNKLYSILNFNSGESTYRLIPCQLFMKKKKLIDEWLNRTSKSK